MYFEDKSDLFLYLMDRFADTFTEAVCQQLEEAEGDLFQAFRRLFDLLRERCSDHCREGSAAEVITILRRNAGMPHTMAMGQRYGRRFLSRIVPRLDRSALALEGEAELEKLKKALCRLHKKKDIVFDIRTDPSLVGGFTLELEGVTYDKSVRGALSGLSRQLEERRMA